MDRRQWTAIALILMLGVAETRRLQAEVAHRGGRFSQGGDLQTTDTRLQTIDVKEDLKTRIGQLNSTLDEVLNGRSWFGYKLCYTTCLPKWVQIGWYQWRMRRNADKMVRDAFGASGSVRKQLHKVDLDVARNYHETMRKSAWTFIKAVDNSAFQRIILTLTLGPLALIRKATGLRPLGLCFMKQSWADVHAHSDYRQNSHLWWSAILAGCPDVDENAELPPALDKPEETAKLLDDMIYTLSKSNGLTDEADEAAMEAKWAKASSHQQCVLKFGRDKNWDYRELTIDRGIISWTSTNACNSSYLDQFGSSLKYTKRFAAQFLTSKEGESPVKLVGATVLDEHRDDACILLENPYREFKFCAYKEGETMGKAKETIDEHLKLLSSDREMLATSAKLERLIATADGTLDYSESKELLKQMDDTGDQGLESVSSEVDSSKSNLGDSAEEQEAQDILNKIRTGASLVESGQNITLGTALLQEAYAEAHGHEGWKNVMKGATSLEITASSIRKGGELVVDGGGTAAAGTAGGLSTAQIILLVFLCGFGCAAFGVIVFGASLLEQSEEDDEEEQAEMAISGNHTKSSAFRIEG